MEKLIIGFSRPKKWKPFAWLIMKGYGTNYDHVYVKFHSDYYDRDIIYQASSVMINFMGTKVFENDNIIVKEFSVDMTSDTKRDLMKFAIDNAGKPYSMKEVLGLAIVRIAELLGKKIENPFKTGTDEYVCSVLGAYILENFGGTDVPGDFENVTPKMLYEFLLTKLPSSPDSDKS